MIAGRDALPIVYMIPVDQTFQDIQRAFQTDDVRLPSSLDLEAARRKACATRRRAKRRSIDEEAEDGGGDGHYIDTTPETSNLLPSVDGNLRRPISYLPEDRDELPSLITFYRWLQWLAIHVTHKAAAILVFISLGIRMAPYIVFRILVGIGQGIEMGYYAAKGFPILIMLCFEIEWLVIGKNHPVELKNLLLIRRYRRSRDRMLEKPKHVFLVPRIQCKHGRLLARKYGSGVSQKYCT